jgi:O-antigen ligase
LIIAGTLFLILFAPLSFGAVEPWAETTLEVSALAIFVAWFLKARAENQKIILPPFGPALALLIVLGGIQLIPLPPAMRSFLVSTLSLNNLEASQRWLPLSSDWPATLFTMLFLSALLALSFAVSNQMITPARMHLLLYSLVLLGLFEALYGLAEFWTNHQHIFWYRKTYYREEPTGTFINHNHYAAFIGMILPLSIGLLIQRLKDWKDIHRQSENLGQRRNFSFNLPVLFISSISMLLALILSNSRGGILASFLSLAFLLFFLLKKRIGIHQRYLAVVLGIPILGALIIFNQVLIYRFSFSIRDAPERFELWKDSLDIIRDAPLLGTGLGSYARVIPKYRNHRDLIFVSGIPLPADVHFAHNDYVQLATEGGLMALCLLVWAISSTASALLRRFRQMDRWESQVTGYCLIAGLLMVLTHALVDFNFHIPAIALVFCILLCLACNGTLGTESARPFSKSPLAKVPANS